MSEFQNQNWTSKFANAFRGLGIVFRTQRSFWVHLLAAVLVGCLSWWAQVSVTEGMILAICVVMVITAEIFNTAIEFLARRVTDEDSILIRNSLDAAAGAVLVAALGATAVGFWILIPRLAC